MFSSSWSPLGSYDINLYCVCSLTYYHPVRYFPLFRYSLYRSKPQNWKSQYPPPDWRTMLTSRLPSSTTALHEVLGQKNFKWACAPLCHEESILACYVTSVIFIPSSLLFCKRFDCLFFKTLCFLRSVIRSVIGPWSDQWSKPVQILSTPLRFRTPDISMVTLPSLQTVPRWGPHCHLAPVVLK